ncbi:MULTISPECIES: hypothetical protein [Asanoa]|uniref:Uncharacterized protein n=2 Tax=Asanoa TaxID=195964 RepID=A0A239PGB9_9ACTN|nr:MULTISPECIES: hypothetical protein [Asanoa]GIF75675.1 hypothetical protein Asi02nite_51930 [Asanoa siamensis]SNT65855.1 hypothetical protein SAMN05421812_1281 [Asanoa hainanensis]
MLTIAGYPAAAPRHHTTVSGVTLLTAEEFRGAAAHVAVQFDPEHRRSVTDEETDPDATVLLVFTTTGTDHTADAAVHHRLVDAIGAWLTGRHLPWSWRFEDDVWTVGHTSRP